MGHYLPKVLACGILDLARRQLLAPLSCGAYKNELDWQLAAISCGGVMLARSWRIGKDFRIPNLIPMALSDRQRSNIYHLHHDWYLYSKARTG